jgi:hypothetical protein
MTKAKIPLTKAEDIQWHRGFSAGKKQGKSEAYEDVLKLARTKMNRFWGYPMKKGSRYTLHDMGHKFEDELKQRIKELKK